MRPLSRHQPNLRPRSHFSEARFHGHTRCLPQLKMPDAPRTRSPQPRPTLPYLPSTTLSPKPSLEMPMTPLPPRRSQQRKQFPHAPRLIHQSISQAHPTRPSMTHARTRSTGPMVPRHRHGKWGGLDLVAAPHGTATHRRPQSRLGRPCIACRTLQTRFQRSCIF